MRVNLIPMAGEGKRYREAGYAVPKPFIEVQEIPMVVRAARALPPADKWIFVCRREHLEQYGGEKIIAPYFPNVHFVVVDRLTEGQACTCMLAEKLIPQDAMLTIGPSDNDMIYDQEQFKAFADNKDIDGWIWTFRHNPAVLQNPKMYGWVELQKRGQTLAKAVRCKQPLSNTPMEDHAVIGAFTFRHASIFFDSVRRMIEADCRINGEFYADVAADFAIQAGYHIHAFEVGQYICWGTPADFVLYNRLAAEGKIIPQPIKPYGA